MVSLRFTFLFSQPRKPPITGRFHAHSRRVASAVACSVAASEDPSNPFLRDALNFFRSNFKRSSPVWGSLSLAADPYPVTDPNTGVAFPSVLGDSRRLLGIGLRRKCVMGLKNIDVYTFGVYADNGDINKVLGEKYGKASASEIENMDLIDDLMESDICMTVRLQIVYGRLSIRSVRSAFAESVGNRLQKFGGSDSTDNKELLQRFTSQFKDEFKIPRGSIIDLSRERDHVLRTTIDGKEVGSIQSKLLCRSILDLYIGDDPFDRRAKEDIELNLASCIQK
ncbi:fatty-acid-binding protein 1-like [Actinidia eriantha]|uniref:fatty-acid-binding protein 1-like n=1 Tax=Actinidia eriantha TaxID=165200 RepID=UPI00258DD820|nr:fatty-acid-binding protein 1-like [Actinidia eriantha]